MQAGLHLTATQGFSAPEARICYERAESLCHSLNRPHLLYSSLMGRWRYSLMTDKLTATLQVAKRIYSLGKGAERCCATDRSLSRFCGHALFSGRFRDFRAIRDVWRSALAFSS